MIDLSRWRQVTPSTSELFAEEGARVVAADVIRLPPFVGGVRTERLDVTDVRAWRRAVATTLSTEGRLDVLVNNAGVIGYSPVDTLDLDGINFASIWGAATVSGAHAYHAAKGAVRT